MKFISLLSILSLLSTATALRIFNTEKHNNEKDIKLTASQMKKAASNVLLNLNNELKNSLDTFEVKKVVAAGVTSSTVTPTPAVPKTSSSTSPKPTVPVHDEHGSINYKKHKIGTNHIKLNKIKNDIKNKKVSMVDLKYDKTFKKKVTKEHTEMVLLNDNKKKTKLTTVKFDNSRTKDNSKKPNKKHTEVVMISNDKKSNVTKVTTIEVDKAKNSSKKDKASVSVATEDKKTKRSMIETVAIEKVKPDVNNVKIFFGSAPTADKVTVNTPTPIPAVKEITITITKSSSSDTKPKNNCGTGTYLDTLSGLCMPCTKGYGCQKKPFNLKISKIRQFRNINFRPLINPVVASPPQLIIFSNSLPEKPQPVVVMPKVSVLPIITHQKPVIVPQAQSQFPTCAVTPFPITSITPTPQVIAPGDHTKEKNFIIANCGQGYYFHPSGTCITHQKPVIVPQAQSQFPTCAVTPFPITSITPTPQVIAPGDHTKEKNFIIANCGQGYYFHPSGTCQKCPKGTTSGPNPTACMTI